MPEALDHSALVEELKKPDFYPHPVESVEYIQTHISSVFLTGGLVYKLKKPVDFGFLDFSTPDLRRRYCEAEVELNRRLAPEVYLCVTPITLVDGRPVLGGNSEPVDWVVVMRQLDQRLLGLRVLERGELTGELIDAVIEQLIPFYEQAAVSADIDRYGQPEVFKVNTDENFEQTREWIGKAITQTQFDEIQASTNRFYELHRSLFQSRIDLGRIRECHGDLHLGNIFFTDPPVIFDCIEFNERFRCSDVAADLGFLAMDLDFRGFPELAHHLITVYGKRSGDRELPEIIDFYRCYRAYVRGKIACFTAADPSLDDTQRTEQMDLARRFFALAHRYAGNERRPVLAVVFGLMGTGKTSLVGYLRDRFGWSMFNSDTIRKDMAGVGTITRVYVPYNAGLYSPEMNRRTFDAMYDLAATRLKAGQSVVLDGSFKSRDERARVTALAERCGADIVFINTVCEPEEQRRRLVSREAKNPNGSDGRVELIENQRRDFEAPHPDRADLFITVETDGPKDENRERLVAELKERELLD